MQDSGHIERTARSYYWTYASRFLAIEAIEQEIAVEKARPFINKARIEFFRQVQDYLKDRSNPVV